jgi:lipoic acid synthetase
VNYVVITSVDRDDLPDGGAGHFARTVELCKLMKPDLRVECLMSDFQGDASSVCALAACPLDVYAHNVETVERLQPLVRDKRASYRQSLNTLAMAKRAPRFASLPPLYTKTSLMLGLGETAEEVYEAMADMRAAGVDVLTLGQYLRPTLNHLAVVE